MIAMLRGMLAEKQPDQILLDVGGVGYQVFIALSTYETLPDPGEEVRILTLTHVREDAFHLYGFATQEEKKLFVLLNNVNGIGARLALSALSAMSTHTLASAIHAEELSTLCRIPGVGRKTAQRLVIELKDRLPPELFSPIEPHQTDHKEGEETPSQTKPKPTNMPSPTLLREEIRSALIHLGYKRPQVEHALAQLLTQGSFSGDAPFAQITTVGEGLRAALKLLSQQAASS